jgi:hypothetical protein
MRRPKTLLVIVQEGGSTGELYAHGFTRRRAADRFLRSCARAAYRATMPVRIPAATDIEAIQAVLDAVGDGLM